MDIPLNHLPFGPNWFCPQIVSFSQQLDKIGIGINDSVHIMNFNEKKPLYDLFADQNQKLRVTAILIEDNDMTYVAYQNHFGLFQQNQLSWCQELPLKNILFINKINDEIYLIDQTEGIFKFSSKQFIQKFTSKIKNSFQNLLVFENQINTYDNDYTLVKSVKTEFKILDSDIQNDLLVLLTKDKQKFEVMIYKDFEQIQKFEIVFKLSLADKPSLCIRFLGENLIITGAKGEIFEIFNYQETKSILLDANNVNTFYQGDGAFEIETIKYKTFIDNPHYKPIYQIYKKNQYLIFLSQDRKISFFKEGKLYYTLDMLQCKYLQLHVYQNSIFALGADNTIRKWNLKKQDSYYSSNIWKHLNNLNITNIILNQKQEGIFCFSTENQLGIYDISAQKLIRLTESLGQRILQIFWTNQTKFIPSNNLKIVQQDKSYTKQLNQQQHVLAILENKIIFWNFIQSYQLTLELPQNFTLNSCDYIQDINLLALGSKQGMVAFYFLGQKIQLCQAIELKQPISSIKFKTTDDMLLIAIGCFDRSINLLQLFVNEESISYQMIHNLKHKSPIQKLQWGYNFELLGIGYHNSCIQIWNMDPDLDKFEEMVNIRGHRGYVQDCVFIQQDLVVSCSDDQSIKLWDITKCNYKKQQNKKKRKKIKLND